jgi:hypothetical protein
MGGNMSTVRWLHDIHDYISNDSSISAQKVVTGIYDRTQILARFPEIGYILCLICSTIILFACCATAKEKIIPLQWLPTSHFEALKAGKHYALTYSIEFVDDRDNKVLIGQNIEKQKRGEVVDIKTADSVTKWCTVNTVGVLKQNGFKVSAEDSADVKIVFHLAKFFVVEDNMYNGEFELRVEAFDKSGKNIWIGTTKGSSSRFGRSLKPQNYNETFSDALLDAVSALFKEQSFISALIPTDDLKNDRR